MYMSLCIGKRLRKRISTLNSFHLSSTKPSYIYIERDVCVYVLGQPQVQDYPIRTLM